jgi:hypothetical protein
MRTQQCVRVDGDGGGGVMAIRLFLCSTISPPISSTTTNKTNENQTAFSNLSEDDSTTHSLDSDIHSTKVQSAPFLNFDQSCARERPLALAERAT